MKSIITILFRNVEVKKEDVSMPLESKGGRVISFVFKSLNVLIF